MIQLQQSHTAEYLAQVICNLLLQYNIKPQQIIAITTDNGANVLKMVTDLSSQMEYVESVPSQVTDGDIEFGDVAIENYLQNVPEVNDQEAMTDIFNLSSDDEEEQIHESLLNAVVENVQRQQNPNSIWNVQGIRCAEHTLQLCIENAMSKLTQSIQNVIKICRNFSVKIQICISSIFFLFIF